MDQEFRDAFNEKLKELQEDGTVKEIVTSFGFAEEDVELAETLTVEDLVEDTEDSGDEEGSDEESPDAEESPEGEGSEEADE